MKKGYRVVVFLSLLFINDFHSYVHSAPKEEDACDEKALVTGVKCFKCGDIVKTFSPPVAYYGVNFEVVTDFEMSDVKSELLNIEIKASLEDHGRLCPENRNFYEGNLFTLLFLE